MFTIFVFYLRLFLSVLFKFHFTWYKIDTHIHIQYWHIVWLSTRKINQLKSIEIVGTKSSVQFASYQSSSLRILVFLFFYKAYETRKFTHIFDFIVCGDTNHNWRIALVWTVLIRWIFFVNRITYTRNSVTNQLEKKTANKFLSLEISKENQHIWMRTAIV